MKRILLFSLLLLLTPGVWAKGSNKVSFTVKALRVALQGDSLCVSFQAIVGKDATGDKNHKLTLTPVLTDSTGTYSMPLTPIEVYGRRVEILDSRGRRKSGSALAANDFRLPTVGAIHAHKGRTLFYSVTLPWQSWMNGARLQMDRTRSGCCKIDTLQAVLLGNDVITVHPPLRPFLATTRSILERAYASTADSIASEHSFVASVSLLDKARKKSGSLFNLDMPLNMGRGMESNKQQQQVDDFIAAGESGSLMVHFPQGRSEIERYYRGNNPSLVHLISAVRAIDASNTSRIAKIIIAGFASPEGSLEKNDRLAWNRALALKAFIINNSNQKSKNIHLFNGSEDWRGLRRMVAESDMYEKQQILNIIDNVPIRQGRELQLMNLQGGNPYRFMLKEMFPELRNAAYIKVYYENIIDNDAARMRQAVGLVAEGAYDKAMELLTQVAPGTNRDYLMGVCLVMTSNKEEGKTLLQQAADSGSTDARLMLDDLDARQRIADKNAKEFAPVSAHHK